MEVLDAIYDMVDSNQELVDTLTTSINQRSEEGAEYEYFRERLMRRQAAERSKRLDHVRTLATYKQVISKKTCPCGKHKSLLFKDKDGNVVEELCPLHWWVNKTWVAFTDHKLKSFLETAPPGCLFKEIFTWR